MLKRVFCTLRFFIQFDDFSNIYPTNHVLNSLKEKYFILHKNVHVKKLDKTQQSIFEQMKEYPFLCVHVKTTKFTSMQ